MPDLERIITIPIIEDSGLFQKQNKKLRLNTVFE